MLKELKAEFNKTVTENGDKAYKSTESGLLDFFSSAGAMRASSDQDVLKKFVFAWDEDPTLALKALFYFRDIRGGQGERRLFRTILNYLGDNHADRLKPLVKLIPEYGRWDDLLVLLNTKVEDEVVAAIEEQLREDVESEKPSLLAKWLPSENTSSKTTKLHAKYLIKKLGLNSRVYRKTLSKLRATINVLERTMSAKEWKAIEYDKIPSKAGMRYRTAFFRNDQERYEAFLQSVEKGEKKINSGTLYPYEIYNQVTRSSANDRTLDEMWKALPNYVKEGENALVMADVSGSMHGDPMAVSVSLALYFAERNKGPFANHFMTFSGEPDLVEIKGSNIYEKMSFIQRSHWEMNTNIERAFNTILKTAVEANVGQEDLPKRLYIISDMQFDGRGWGATVSGRDKSSFERARAAFASHGYALPEIVFWNVRDTDNKPVTKNDVGVQLVSGLSPTLFKQITSGLSATDLMLEILNGERYEPIK